MKSQEEDPLNSLSILLYACIDPEVTWKIGGPTS